MNTCAIISLDAGSVSHGTKNVPGSAKFDDCLDPPGDLGFVRVDDGVDDCRENEQEESLRCWCAQKLGSPPAWEA